MPRSRPLPAGYCRFPLNPILGGAGFSSLCTTFRMM